MIYFTEGELTIRDMRYEDVAPITDAEREQGWNATEDKYFRRLEDQKAGKAISMVAEYAGKPVGYINVYPDSVWGAFGGKGIPEIMDFGVLEKYQNRGVGTALMDAAEAVAARFGDTVYLGVGLHSGYGSAQRMYVKRGYIPDGSGVWYQDKVCENYGECRNDDDLVLYLLKKLDTCAAADVL